MPRTTYNKLVRDGIPEIITNNGGTPTASILTDEAYIIALTTKLLEEAQEVSAAHTREEVLEECADVLEVITALASAHNFSLEELRTRQEEKARKRGGFAKRVFLEYVDEA